MMASTVKNGNDRLRKGNRRRRRRFHFFKMPMRNYLHINARRVYTPEMCATTTKGILRTSSKTADIINGSVAFAIYC